MYDAFAIFEDNTGDGTFNRTEYDPYGPKDARASDLQKINEPAARVGSRAELVSDEIQSVKHV